MRVVRLVPGVVVGLATLAVGAGGALAAAPSTPYDALRLDAPNSQEGGRWGERIATAGDVNRDGVNDFYVATPLLDIGGIEDAGRVYLMSGDDRALLRVIDSPALQEDAQFGFFISVFGDGNGDGTPDIAIGTNRQDTTAAGVSCDGGAGCNVNQGKAWVFSGRTGEVLYELDNPDPQPDGRFGSRLGTAGDVTRDGRADVLVGSSSNDVPAGCGEATNVPANCRENQGQAYIFNGATGALVREYNLPDPVPTPPACSGNCGTFGLAVQSPGDTNGDGVADQLINAGSFNYDTSEPPGSPSQCRSDGPAGDCNESQGRMYLFSGADGSVLLRIDDPEPQRGAVFGFQDAAPFSPGDVNGDGLADVYGNGFGQDGPAGESQGRAWVFNGRTGAVIYRLDDPTPTRGGQFGWSLARTDYNEDATPDLYIGSSPHHVPGADQNGGTYVFDGRNAALLKSLELPQSDRQITPAGNLGPNLGWGLAAPGDLNRDGEPDYLAGAPFLDVGLTENQGRVYAFLSRVPVAPPPPPRPGAEPPFAGCPPRAAARSVIALTSGNDVRNGTLGADLIFAGAGGDRVDGLAGDDCVDLGTGNDRGRGSAGNDYVVGGTGNDLVSGSSGNDRLRGNSGGDRLVAGTGNDAVLAGSGNDSLYGGLGNDELHGQSGRDRILGSRGRDHINGGGSGDRITGDSSPDRIHGDSGNDRINGGSSGDLLRGNSGHDRITGLTGRDRISGGSGNDRLLARDGRGGDRIACGTGFDRVIADRGDRVSRSCERVRRVG